MPDDPAARTRQRLQALQESFRSHLSDMVERVRSDWRDLHTTVPVKNDPAVIQQLYASVHRITGSAGSFGYHAVSEAAAPLEILLGAVHQSGQAPSDEVGDQISLFLEHLLEVWRLQGAPEGAPTGDLADGSLHRPPFDPGTLYAVGDVTAIGALGEQLAPFGYRLLTFPDAEAVIHACQEDPPAVVLWFSPLDALGDTAAQLGGVPVLALPDQPSIENRLLAVRRGCQGYLQRPVDLTDLVVWIEQLTRRGGQPGEPYRVLIVDDDEHLAESYRLVLQMAGIMATVLTQPLRVLEILVGDCPDLILMDIHMPDCSGLELVQVIRQHLSYLHIPIVFLSADGSQDRQLRARILGGDDFLPKPVSARRLVQVVRSRAERSRALRTALRLDGLTGLYNQVGLKERLTVELLRAKRHVQTLSLALMDIDHFHDFNQTHGYAQGDQALKALTRVLTRRLRRTDISSRYGGGEFAVILIDTDAASAVRVVDEIRRAFADIELGGEGQARASLTLSCGITDNTRCEDAAVLLAAARQALREAKADGRNRVVSNHSNQDVKP